MALKGGKIFQEMMEVPDKQEDGCLAGCISWLIGFSIIIGILVLGFNFLMSHPIFLFGFIAVALFIGVKVSK
ncbi:preprotein translocase, SecE subunit domain protein [Enterococcus faecalis]|nr:preprotein translocase, SecE subunit domain protein [Enterococcus faecalis]EHQ8827440.1 preprotein translocase, SecE subunit domain protein [Enterococcus faecalis]HAP3647617.1 preprotein translocase, SecE subunit domain protein [Enterococcus faecalis]